MDTCQTHFAERAPSDDFLHPVVLDDILLFPLVDIVVILDAQQRILIRIDHLVQLSVVNTETVC